ncbi:Hypothetical Protein FCC1311_034102 [Hondaea fermentalgiana]|uniref:Peptidase M12B domain-containing protein n=1 Tax=Hondaea fermentalgiana TaxID=2315210 RepID=A0A2R5G817_9STRA|nr:Hypothetical Protein FCC1311_034102 [Hondaea fermentalgiana]|eukprot:GBG27187.1 Hypothetical Protein FCC1311_034102 [Hondaea fermentalgiana]
MHACMRIASGPSRRALTMARFEVAIAVIILSSTQSYRLSARKHVEEISTKLYLNESMLPFQDLFQAEQMVLPLVIASDEIVDFALQRSSVLPASLRENFPGFVSYSGPSVDRSLHMRADIDYSPVKGLRAVIRKPGVADYYIDPLHRAEQIYHMYSSRPSLPGFTAVHRSANGVVDELGECYAQEYTFTIAFVANGEYSQYHGNTVQSVLAEIVTLANRINGILRREVGINLQLHEKSADLICLHPCDDLRNSHLVLDDLDDFIGPVAHVSRTTYDLAHALTTDSGGLACLGVLCDEFYSSCGTTGLPDPITDAYYVDYVLHEIGHQLGAQHTFVDCVGANSHRNPGTAVEPGSGSTVLGYAGICGASNLQTNSDAYFHAITLAEIHAQLTAKAFPGSNCGSVVETEMAAPEVSVNLTCVVPAAMPFQISIKAPSQESQQDGINSTYLYTIEELEPAAQVRSYTSPSTPRFRSWEPSGKRQRTFPNLYYLIYEVDGLDEILPSQSANMTFRVTVRRETQDSIMSDSGNVIAPGLGISNFRDVEVQFRGDLAPLKDVRVAPVAESHRLYDGETPAAQNSSEAAQMRLVAGEAATLSWDQGDSDVLAPNVEILIAPNTMEYVGNVFASYAEEVHELSWVSLGIVPNVGSATFVVPELENANVDANSDIRAVFMVRQPPASDGSCFFFEVVSKALSLLRIFPGVLRFESPKHLIMASVEDAVNTHADAPSVFGDAPLPPGVASRENSTAEGCDPASP